ncbi:unnamed protein product [Moneuplotes crassus]|uniref:Uncharacterized protein n=1 Tax=Euplotes crassus TaxID=5936 RepID=A0AAD1X7J2_EUPCR|nr:unnamed protein product [Moneuplotes crassus]
MQKIAKMLQKEFKVYELEGCKYFVPPKIFEVGEDCQIIEIRGSEGITFWESYPVCRNEDTWMLEEQKCSCLKIAQIMENLKTIPVEQVLRNILSSVLEIKVSNNVILNKSIALIEFSKKLKLWSKNLQARNCRLKTVRLFLSFWRYYKPREENDSLFEPLVPFAQSCIRSGLSLQVTDSVEADRNSPLQANLCYWIIKDQALVMKKFEDHYCGRHFTNKECLVLDRESVNLSSEIIDVIILCFGLFICALY